MSDKPTSPSVDDPDTKQEPAVDPAILKAQDRAKTAEAELQKLRDADKSRKDADKATKKAASDKAALERGEYQTLISNRDAEAEGLKKDLANANAKNEAFETSQRARVATMISGLPDDAKNRVALVQDELSLPKLIAFVEAEATLVKVDDSSSPPPGLVPGKADKYGKRRTLTPRTHEILDMCGVESQNAEEVPMTVDEDGNKIFRYSVKQLIEKLKSVSVGPVSWNAQKARERLGE